MSTALVPPHAANIILLRHGETQWNREGRCQGHRDSPLTLTGIGQVRAITATLLETLGDLRQHRLYASPLARARQSISIFCEQAQLDYDTVEFDDRLMERCYGRWEGLTRQDITRLHPEDLEGELQNRWTYAVPDNGESFLQVEARLRAFLEGIPAGQAAIIMAHNGTGSVMRGLCTGMTPHQIFAGSSAQSTAFKISGNNAQAIEASPSHLRAFGGSDTGTMAPG